MPRTAWEAGLTKLYHYESFNSDYLKDTLTNQRVHCSDPANLNDPWDCRPWFDEACLDASEAIEQFIDKYFSHCSPTLISTHEKEATIWTIRNDPGYRREILERFSKDFLEMIPKRWRIYCLTPVPDSTLMWSHYAKNHQGICLEFALESAVFGSAQEVTYLSSYPSWAPHTLESHHAQILLTKAEDWQYEREYRVIALADIDRSIKEHPLILSGDFLRLAPGALQAVIAGCEADCAKIADVVRASAPGVRIKRAVRANGKFKLEIVEWEP